MKFFKMTAPVPLGVVGEFCEGLKIFVAYSSFFLMLLLRWSSLQSMGLLGVVRWFSSLGTYLLRVFIQCSIHLLAKGSRLLGPPLFYLLHLVALPFFSLGFPLPILGFSYLFVAFVSGLFFDLCGSMLHFPFHV